MGVSKPLSSVAASEIASLAKRISVAEGLDGEIQAELRGHIEDKVRGYLSGTLKVTEADALLLAKAHFGDAAVIKGMFRDVHAKVHALSYGRRILVAAAIYLFVSNGMILIGDSILAHSSFAKPPQSFGPTEIPPDSFIVQFLYTLVAPILSLFAIRWLLRLLQGASKSPIQILRYFISPALLLCAGLGLGIFIQPPILRIGIYPWSPIFVIVFSHMSGGQTSGGFIAWQYSWAAILVLAFTAAFSAWIWISWCDQSPRTVRSILPAMISWLLFVFLSGPTTFIGLIFTAILHPSKLALVWTSFLRSGTSPWEIELIFYVMIALFVVACYSISRRSSRFVTV